MRILSAGVISVLCVFVLSCKKNPSENKDNNNNDFSVTNTWQCEINGVTYSGTVDTSFTKMQSGDTVLFCTGTANDKKANIDFYLWINRSAWGHDSILVDAGSRFYFDTTGSNYWMSGLNLGGLIFKIDSFSGTKMKGRFYGPIKDSTAVATGEQQLTNGEISFDVGRGNNEPKFYSFQANIGTSGYIKGAVFRSNTLIMDGRSFTGDSTFQLMIRTGSQVKTGIFESKKGDIGLEGWRPSLVTHFVSDTIGDLVVNIESVTGDIVQGTFSGLSQGDNGSSQVSIAGGKFKCRIKNYIPQQDSLNKWGFSESNGLQYPFHTVGGNIINASRSQDGGWFYLTVNGESDNGASKFKIVVSSISPISTGVYEIQNSITFRDTVYFYSPTLRYAADHPSHLFCIIDSIDNRKVVGRLTGTINNGAYYDGSGSIKSLRKGYFQANF